jgi:hypothetical protein
MGLRHVLVGRANAFFIIPAKAKSAAAETLREAPAEMGRPVA